MVRPNVACSQVPADRCELVTDFHRLEELSSQWERLWESDPRAEIFQTPEWSRAWWRAFGQNYSLCSLVVFAGNEVVGIVPMVRRDNVLQFLGLPEADYADIICEEHRATEVLTLALKTLSESITDWKECAFQHLPRHSRLVRYYKALPREIRARMHRGPAERQYTIILRNQREELFKSLLGKNHTRRLQNKLRKAGQLRFRHLQTPEEIEPYLPDFFRHHVRRHAAIGRRSVCARPEFCQFIRAIVQELGPTGRVRFGVLELDGRALAWELAFQVNGKFMLYQHTFDLDSSHYTPGEVILWNALEYARDNVSREFDFGSGDELYKDRFANYSRETYSLFVSPRGLRGWIRGSGRGVHAFVQPGFAKLKEIAKSRRMTLRAFRAVRMWMLGTWGCVRQARENGSLLQCCLHLTKKMFGNSVWSRRSADVFASESSRMGDEGPFASAPGDRDREVSVAQFGDLVDLSWRHPEILSLNELAQCRKRLQNGDRVYIVREKSDVVSASWASSPADAEAGPGTARIGIAASTPAIVVDEFWSIRDRDLSASYRLLLSVLARNASSLKANLLVYCSSDQAALRRELQRQGFFPKFQITRYRAFGRLERESVRPHPANSSYSAQAA